MHDLREAFELDFLHRHAPGMNQPKMTGRTVRIAVSRGIVAPLLSLVFVVGVGPQRAAEALGVLAAEIVSGGDAARNWSSSPLALAGWWSSRNQGQ